MPKTLLIEKRKTHELVEFTEKTDRIYFNVKSPLELNDNARKLIIESRGFEDIVVWKPLDRRCKKHGRPS